MTWLAINKSAGNMLLRILLRWGMLLLLLVQWLILLLLPRLLLLSQATHPVSKNGCMNSELCPSITQLSANRQYHWTSAGQ
jgi:hypothetical protein